jgi:hypothetical protein
MQFHYKFKDSFKDLQKSRTFQGPSKFKYFSRTFQGPFNFKDISRPVGTMNLFRVCKRTRKYKEKVGERPMFQIL